jgi:hypothetical protein
MDTYGTRDAIQTMNQARQFVAEHNATVNQANVKREEDKDAKIEQDNLIGDFNYAKDTIGNLYTGSGVKDAYNSYNKRVSKQQLKEQAKKDLLSKIDDVTTEIQKPVEEVEDDRPPFVSSTTPSARQSFTIPTNQADTPPTNLRRSFAIGEKLDANDVFSQALDRPPEPEPEPEKAPNVKQATPDNDDAPSRLSTAPEGSEPEKSDQDLTTKLIKGATGVEDDTAELIGRVGGAVAGASMGGIGLYDDISNKVKTGKFFNPKDSFADDVSNVSGIIAGASDVVGLIPGLEWVAGVGNAIGGVGGIVKMFGDHDKNVKTQQDDANKFKPEQDISNTPSSYIGTIDQTAQSNIRQATTSAGVY